MIMVSCQICSDFLYLDALHLNLLGCEWTGIVLGMMSFFSQPV